MTKKIKIVLTIAAGLFLPLVSLASVTISFDNGTNTNMTPGTSVILTGKLTNTDSQAVFITSNFQMAPGNASSSTSTAISITVDPATYGYLPAQLSPAQVYSGPLLKLNASAASAIGDFSANYAVLGGASTSSSTVLGEQFFFVHVLATSTPVITSSSTPASTTTDFSKFVGLQMQGEGETGGLQIPDNGLQQQASGQFQNGPRLIQLSGSNDVYWVSPGNIKIIMLTPKVFSSYGNKDADVQTVGQAEFDSFPTARYIWLNGKGGIYKTEGASKRLISIQAWADGGLGADSVININRTDFDSYSTGSKVTDAADLKN